MKIFILLLLTVLTFTACNKKKKQAKLDDEIIANYISENQLNATKTADGLYYVITKEGVGEHPTSNSTVKVAYKGFFTTNSIFDESDTTGVSFSLTNVIQGWQKGIPYFKPGGKGLLLIPSAMGYGRTAKRGIPANSVLIFRIDLKEVQ